MLTVLIDGRYAIPIRAIPYCSHGFLSASDVAAFLAHPNSIGGEFDPQTCDNPDHPLTRYDGPPYPFRIDAFGRIERLHPGIFHSIPHLVEAATITGQMLDAVAALPPGVFVWQKDVKALFDFLDFQLYRQEYNARGDVENFRHWLDDPFLGIDAVTMSTILDGVDQAANATVKRTVKRSGAGGIDPDTQAAADKEAEIFRKSNGRLPKKKELASILADTSGRKYGTVMREIRSPKARK